MKVTLVALKAAFAVCVPVPVSGTVCGEVATESVNIKDAARLPAAAGEKVTDTEQLVPAAKTLPQVVVMTNSEEFVPVSQMLRMLRDAVPVLESVTVLGALAVPTFWFPNDRLAGDITTCGTAELFPVPVKVAFCEEPAALSELPVTVRVPLSAPVAVGTKATAVMQSEPAEMTEDEAQSEYPEDF